MSAGSPNRPAVAGLATGLALALMLGGCAGPRVDSAGSPPPSPRETTSPSGGGGPRVWIAVFESAADPNDLDADAEELMERAGTAVVVAPEGCFGALRGEAGIRPGHYVLGLMAETRQGLDEAVAHADREPILTARVEDLCPM